MARDWEMAYEQNETPWDKGYASPPLLEFLQQNPILGRVLVPGCGTGHDVRALAAQGAQVLGLDVAPSAVRKALAFPCVRDERYEAGDFLNLDAGHCAAYDWVVEHTCLCALDPCERVAYARAVQQALKPGGYYLAVFYREVSDYTGDGPPHPITPAESHALFAPVFEPLEAFVPAQGYASRPVGSEEVCLWRKM
ncbi:methyltransferase domain-containing protein [Coraliomargarita sp. SDUM461004]|uniref:Methyltransferase domain-containing protein n=1 Tax=Thalassobacterium sedimentorum TaxID=3041258 RepID=A0ABU1AML3_9BACT|nr:methyltransferase [Coraliomargarita sp. SDUM461004]MDQ8195453.1 methyltransferase domain-containing protein [Coraliomargarita sp. SDUM461004]